MTECVPAIGKYDALPDQLAALPLGVRAPFAVSWPFVRLATRIPGIVASRRSTVTWLERPFDERLPTLEWLLGTPLVFDVDDAIWLTQPWGVQAARRVACHAARVVVGNHYLADWFSTLTTAIDIIPTAIDTQRFIPRTAPPNERFVVGWIGTASNMPYLAAIEASLARLMNTFDDIDLLVVADQPPQMPTLPPERVHYVRWSPTVEAPILQQMNVGIMPLPDTPWTRGKCSFKMLQYMACALPVVVSPVGMNAELLASDTIGMGVVSSDDWYDAIATLYADRDMAAIYGRRGRAIVEQRYSVDVVSACLAGLFAGLV
ncbi:MAG TPA: glycosyltransferase family 4 protein [Roseiflexaceae bacterium]|nr:glycosyltransferase family 4 protein [Roseiflexaceae bacterium]HMP42577.1 glycosyltransferase family 4 protein [Roseiflexaceae bacterium]